MAIFGFITTPYILVRCWPNTHSTILEITSIHRTYSYSAGVTIITIFRLYHHVVQFRSMLDQFKNSSASEETRPRGRLPQVGAEGELADPTAFETSSPLSEAGTEILEGASQEILSGEESTDDGDQDHSVVASSDDISQAPEVGPTLETGVADSGSTDLDADTASDLSFPAMDRFRERLA